MTEQERIERAHRDAVELRGFYAHLTIYLGVMLLLALVDAITGGRWWVQWPAAGWGVGIVAHAVTVYGRRLWGPEWEERKVRSMLAHDRPRAVR
jgi:hypothetical protein